MRQKYGTMGFREKILGYEGEAYKGTPRAEIFFRIF